MTFLRTIRALHIPLGTSQPLQNFYAILDEGMTYFSAGRPEPIRFGKDAQGKGWLRFSQLMVNDLPTCDMQIEFADDEG